MPTTGVAAAFLLISDHVRRSMTRSLSPIPQALQAWEYAVENRRRSLADNLSPQHRQLRRSPELRRNAPNR
ncbi:hypothetical protein NIES4074_22210 [Cylindrospermum sp. NIES-4074]|nr:hypothetical protein NIES4074_22210 [Cylindrospermum sp. NIES-4074]